MSTSDSERRGDADRKRRDEEIERLAVRLIQAGRPWLDAITEATRAVERGRATGRADRTRRARPTAGKRTRTARWPASTGVPLAARPELGDLPSDIRLDII